MAKKTKKKKEDAQQLEQQPFDHKKFSLEMLSSAKNDLILAMSQLQAEELSDDPQTQKELCREFIIEALNSIRCAELHVSDDCKNKE